MAKERSRSPADRKTVPLAKVAALFRQNYKQGPWPSETKCYRLANAIEIVLNASPPKANNDDPGYRQRKAIFNAMAKLIQERKDAQFPGLRFPPLIALERLEKAMNDARDAVLAPSNSMAGERRGAEWHQPARFLGHWVAETIRQTGQAVSVDKHSPFVGVVCDALALAGQGQRTPAAVAAALSRSPL